MKSVKHPSLDHNKMERLSNRPHTGSTFAESHRGIEHFQDFQKADYHHRTESVEHHSVIHNKTDPIVSAFATPHGDKIFPCI